MGAIQRVELRVPAPKDHTNILTLVQPDGAFTGVAPAEGTHEDAPNTADGPVPADSATGTAQQQPASLSADVALRSFLSRVHATGLMVDAPTWRLV